MLHTQYKENYTGRTTPVDRNGLCELVLGCTSRCPDMRLIDVVMRYVSEMGYIPAATDDAAIVLTYQRNGEERARLISASRLLHLCAEKAREAQGNATSAYGRMCAEEDEEELSYLIQILQDLKNGADTRKAQPFMSVVDVEDEYTDDALMLPMPGSGRNEPRIPFWVAF